MSDQNISLLYVDDEQFNLLLFDMNFSDKYTIYTASSGPDALEILEDHQDEIIVVISDMSMPEMNGVEFIRKAREKHAKIAYFILSGYDRNDQIEDALQNREIVEFLTKPFIRQKIEKAIDEVVNA